MQKHVPCSSTRRSRANRQAQDAQKQRSDAQRTQKGYSTKGAEDKETMAREMSMQTHLETCEQEAEGTDAVGGSLQLDLDVAHDPPDVPILVHVLGQVFVVRSLEHLGQGIARPVGCARKFECPLAETKTTFAREAHTSARRGEGRRRERLLLECFAPEYSHGRKAD